MNPFYLPPNSVVSFSGGRTSGYMLRRILDAHGGSLPKDRVVLFCNTGKERYETLDFVQECSVRWNVPIIWLEYRHISGLPVRRSKAGRPVAMNKESRTFAVVDHGTASRRGEPFEAAIGAVREFRAAKGEVVSLPHVVGRYCTAELKIRTMGRYVSSTLGWTDWTSAVGIRADESGRLKSLTGCDYQEDSACRGQRPICPLADAGITERDVMAFWATQPFDLALMQHEGNCDGCFLKKKAKLLDIFRRRPDLADWWSGQEKATGDHFRRDRPGYAELKVIAASETASMFPDPDDLDIDCHCTD